MIRNSDILFYWTPSVSVRDFYQRKGIFVTGGTGFMGKVLVEKLLYSVPGVESVYVLVRPKRGKSVEQRVGDLLKSRVFDRIRKEKPSVLSKLKAIAGDVLTDNLGLSDSDIDHLAENVHIVFHFAATLKLEAPLKDNVQMNTFGTFRALEIAKKFKNLDAFIHLSTAFCYPDYEVLGERLYAPPHEPYKVMRLVETLDEHQLDLLTPSLLGPHPNCYTFSKRLAEDLVRQAYDQGLKAVVARPSIVCPSVAEPKPGWVDSLNGPVGVMLGAGKGVIRTMLCDGSFTAHVIPVDTAVNGLLCIAAIEGRRRSQRPEEMPVYNLTIGHQKRITWKYVLDVAKEYGRKFPLAWPLWYPNGDITTNRTVHEFRRICYHLVPAYLIDFLMLILGQKRFMVRIQTRISNGLELLQFFTMRQWVFPCPKYDAIERSLSEEEQPIFRTDLTNTDASLYMGRCVEGGRVFCFNEDPDKIYLNRIYHNFLFCLDWTLKIFFFLFMISWLAHWFEPVKSILSVGGPVVRHLPLLGKTVFDQ